MKKGLVPRTHSINMSHYHLHCLCFFTIMGICIRKFVILVTEAWTGRKGTTKRPIWLEQRLKKRTAKNEVKKVVRGHTMPLCRTWPPVRWEVTSWF